MTDREIVVLLAGRVMGYRVCRSHQGAGRCADGDDFSNWNPLESIADAGMLVEAIWDNPEIGKHLHDGKGFGAGLVLCLAQRYQIGAFVVDRIWGIGRHIYDIPEHGDPALLGSHVCGSAPRAISLAIAQALGVEVSA